MAIREDRADRARRDASRLRTRLGDELRRTRRSAGLSLVTAGRPCQISASQLSRLERGLIHQPSLEAIVCVSAVVGLEVVIRTYPRGDALRDAGHVRLLERFRRELHPSLTWRTEVPLPIPGDLRAWDAVVSGRGWQIPVEAETVIGDWQALERKLAIKRRDGGFDHVILLVADTSRNRDARQAVTLSGYTSSRAALAAFREGRDPGASGLVIL